MNEYRSDAIRYTCSLQVAQQIKNIAEHSGCRTKRNNETNTLRDTILIQLHLNCDCEIQRLALIPGNVRRYVHQLISR